MRRSIIGLAIGQSLVAVLIAQAGMHHAAGDDRSDRRGPETETGPGDVATRPLKDCQSSSGESESDSLRCASQPVTFTATLRKTEFRPLEPIIVDIELANTFDTPLTTAVNGGSEGDIYQIMRINSFRENGDMVRVTTYHYQNCCVFRNAWPICAGRSSLRRSLIANLVNDLTAPGSYTLVVKNVFSVFDKDKLMFKKVEVSSEPVKFRVSGEPKIDPD